MRGGAHIRARLASVYFGAWLLGIFSSRSIKTVVESALDHKTICEFTTLGVRLVNWFIFIVQQTSELRAFPLSSSNLYMHMSARSTTELPYTAVYQV